MVTVADSAYKANEDLTECTALRGYIILIVGSDTSGGTCHFPGGPCTVLDLGIEEIQCYHSFFVLRRAQEPVGSSTD